MTDTVHDSPRHDPTKPEQHMGLVGLFVSRYCRIRPGQPLADLPQWSDACVGLLTACRLYDPSRGVAFATFARWCIRSAIGSGARIAKRYRDRYTVTDTAETASAAADTLDDQLREWRENSEWLDWAIARLPPRWQPIIAARRAGLSTRHIAADLRISSNSVLVREQEALRYLRELARITLDGPPPPHASHTRGTSCPH